MGKKLLKVLGIVLLVIVVAAGGFVVFLTATEYKPAAVEYIDAPTLGEPETPGDSVRIVTWNVGYCGLGAEEDFVMDGGKGDGKPELADFDVYFNGVLDTLDELEEAYQDSYDEITGMQADMAEALAGYGDLFTEADGVVELGDLQPGQRYPALWRGPERAGGPGHLGQPDERDHRHVRGGRPGLHRGAAGPDGPPI